MAGSRRSPTQLACQTTDTRMGASCSAARPVRAAVRRSGSIRSRRVLGGCPSNHVGCGARSGGCERGARSSLLRRAFRHASSVVATLPALAPLLVLFALHVYPDRLLAGPAPPFARAFRAKRRLLNRTACPEGRV